MGPAIFSHFLTQPSCFFGGGDGAKRQKISVDVWEKLRIERTPHNSLIKLIRGTEIASLGKPQLRFIFFWAHTSVKASRSTQAKLQTFVWKIKRNFSPHSKSMTVRNLIKNLLLGVLSLISCHSHNHSQTIEVWLSPFTVIFFLLCPREVASGVFRW